MMQRSDIQNSHYFVSVTRLLLSEHLEPRPVVELSKGVKLEYVVKCEVYITVYRYPKGEKKQRAVKERILSRLENRREMEARLHLFMNSDDDGKKEILNTDFNLVEVFNPNGVSLHDFHNDEDDMIDN